MKFHSISKAIVPLAMLAGLGMSQAKAADLGGDCCADLEERIAELEATTVRKGNRKVSLKLSGQINSGVLYVDDGVQQDVYVVDNISSSSRFRLTGSAKINSDWSAGFHFEVEYNRNGRSVDVKNIRGGDDSNTGTNNNGNTDGGIDIRRASWYLKSKHLGKLRVGQTSFATDDIGLITVGGDGVVSPDTILWGRTIVTRNNTKAVAGDTLASAFVPGLDTTARSNALRYDSPTIYGFTLSAAWGEDDVWDVAIRYAGEIAGFRIAGGVGYIESTDSISATAGVTSRVGFNAVNSSGQNDSRVLGSISVMHVATGLFVNYAANYGNDGSALNYDTSIWDIRAGWYGKILPLGKTSIYGGYGQGTNDNPNLKINGAAVVATGQLQSDIYEAGIVQHIDAAAMELYLAYKHYNLDAPGITGINDQDYVFAGGRIKF